MKIDGRKAEQNFFVSGNRIYCWKNKKGGFDLGMNGTNLHFSTTSKAEAEEILNFTTWRK